MLFDPSMICLSGMVQNKQEVPCYLAENDVCIPKYTVLGLQY